MLLAVIYKLFVNVKNIYPIGPRLLKPVETVFSLNMKTCSRIGDPSQMLRHSTLSPRTRSIRFSFNKNFSTCNFILDFVCSDCNFLFDHICLTSKVLLDVVCWPCFVQLVTLSSITFTYSTCNFILNYKCLCLNCH